MKRFIQSINETLVDLLKTLVTGVLCAAMVILAVHAFILGESITGVLAVMVVVMCLRD